MVKEVDGGLREIDATAVIEVDGTSMGDVDGTGQIDATATATATAMEGICEGAMMMQFGDDGEGMCVGDGEGPWVRA